MHYHYFFLACGDDDDDNYYEGKIDPKENVFKNGLIKEIDAQKNYSSASNQTNIKFEYNTSGQLSKIIKKEGSDNKTITFTYDSKFTKSNENADVKMTVKDEKYGDQHYFFELGKNGYVKYCKASGMAKDEDGDDVFEFGEFSFEYNGIGQISRIYTKFFNEDEKGKQIDKMSGVVNFEYKNYNITKVVTKVSGLDASSEVLLTYTSDTQKEAIDNTNALMLWNDVFEIDIDNMEYLYFAGLLGKPTSKLPLTCKRTDRYIDLDDNTTGTEITNSTFQWTLNAGKEAIKLEKTESYSSSDKESYGEEKTLFSFVW